LFAALAIAGSVLAPDRGTKVAVVDLHEVLTTAKPFQESDKTIRDWIARQKADLKKQQEALDAKTSELELYSKGSKQRAELELTLKKATLDLDYQVAAADTERDERIVEHQRTAFDKANAAIQKVAAEKQIDVVLQLRRGPLLAQTQTELSSEIFLRDVMFAGPALDITPDVLSILNL
jgi:Skp family chaperone for outer membrane proteins